MNPQAELISAPLSLHLGILKDLIQKRLSSVFEKESFPISLNLDLHGKEVDPLMSFVFEQKLATEEYLLLLLALVPHVAPHFLDECINQELPGDGNFPQIGGVRGKNFRGLIPTGETALFFLAGEHIDTRLSVQGLFHPDHLFSKKHILWLEELPEGEPQMAGRLILNPEYVDLFTQGVVRRPRFNLRFPAQLIETALEWEDLVLNEDTLEQIQDLEIWLNHGNELLDQWEMRRKLKPGYRVLFHGPPGTGKTLTASLLGKYTHRDVYKVDLSMVVSKFIGETEKNLANLFAKAENKDWILFFDEADALFGKRTNVRDAHDKYANQEVSYLLQRVEAYNGLVILASNFKNNIDEAFIRRFQAIIHFPLPKAEERYVLWKNSFPAQVRFSPEVSLENIAQRFELSGAEIMNVVQYCCLRLFAQKGEYLTQDEILQGIRREYFKEGKIMR